MDLIIFAALLWFRGSMVEAPGVLVRFLVVVVVILLWMVGIQIWTAPNRRGRQLLTVACAFARAATSSKTPVSVSNQLIKMIPRF